MARENQGLHAALIVFVVLTIALAVTTFVLFSQYRDANERAAKNASEADTYRNAASDKDKIATSLKEMMGFADADTTDTIRDQFNDDMQKYAPRDVEEQARVYRQVLRRQDEVIKSTNAAYEGELDKVKKLEETLAGINALTDAKLAQFKSRAEDAEKDLARQSLQFEKDRKTLEKSQQDLAAELDQAKKDHQTQIGQKNAQIAKVTEERDLMAGAYEAVKTTVDKMRQEVPDQFQGEIVLVDQRSGNVWINRGRDDGLRPQTKFSIFAAGLTDVAETDKKANIEVTRVLNGHLAEARIVESDNLDPVLVGDKIYTPVWNVGERRHFALVGLIDLDGDGRSDLERMQTLIEMNGGIVDAPMDAQGARKGELSLNTRYLVLGEEPGANEPAAVREDYTQTTAKAEQLRIETVQLNKFLELMGWVRQVKVAKFGGGGYGQFPVEKTSTPAVSPGRVSDLFKPRHPPRSSKSSAY